MCHDFDHPVARPAARVRPEPPAPTTPAHGPGETLPAQVGGVSPRRETSIRDGTPFCTAGLRCR